ncbi:MAG: HD domain-containing protein [Bacilli bacterium]|nr:HD domain-containing protein [Bacilli bacterium]MBN2877480.1 HD domain-containing protein [Bacilli bacterium]
MNRTQEELILKAKEYIKTFLDDDSSGHDTEHVFRVYYHAKKLSEEYHANDFIVGLTALLHDLDDPKIAPENSNRALSFLEENKIKEKDQIMEIIANMSFSSHMEGKSVTTLEGQIVQDADRLDALGAIGIARCFAYSGFKNRPLYKGREDDDSAIAHFYQKLFQLPDLMNTDLARELANERVRFMKSFLQEFYIEWVVKE